MKAAFGHHTGIECWQLHGQHPGFRNTCATKTTRVRYNIAPAQLLEYAASHLGIKKHPLHVLVEKHADRRNSSQVTCHTSGLLPKGMLYQIDSDFALASPELCFLQMAQHLPTLKLIELGMELCGTYQPPIDSSKPLVQRSEPLTTPERLLSCANAASHVRGSKLARRVLPWVRAGSASPMETFLWMRLCLPCRLGGRGFDAALLNHPIKLDAQGRLATGKARLRCDLFFPRARIAVEYDSSKHHTPDERIANDSVRRGALECQGIRVVSITRHEFFTIEEFEGKVRHIAQFTGTRLRPPTQQHAQARKELRNQLLSYGLMNYRLPKGE